MLDTQFFNLCVAFTLVGKTFINKSATIEYSSVKVPFFSPLCMWPPSPESGQF